MFPPSRDKMSICLQTFQNPFWFLLQRALYSPCGPIQADPNISSWIQETWGELSRLSRSDQDACFGLDLIKFYLQELSFRDWRLKPAEKSDAWTRCAPTSPLTWSPCSYRPTAVTPLPMCTGSSETSITRKTELLLLCSSVLRQIAVQTRNWLNIGVLKNQWHSVIS